MINLNQKLLFMTLQEYEVKRVEPFSFGKISAAFMSLMGLITGLLYLPFLAFNLTGGIGIETLAVAVAGIFGIILLAVVYAGVGFAIGVFYGYFYNYLSSKIGGLEMVMDVEG